MHGRSGDPRDAYGRIAARYRVAGPEAWRPALEVYETAAALVVRVELAGVAPDDLEVALDHDALTVEGRREPETHAEADPRQYHEVGIAYGPFRARVRLPFPVERDATEAEYEQGFLTIRLPRAARSSLPTAGDEGAGAVTAADTAHTPAAPEKTRKGNAHG